MNKVTGFRARIGVTAVFAVLVFTGSVTSANAMNTVSYLWQAAAGQFKLENRTRPISAILKDAKTPPALRVLLERVPVIKAFAEASGLKATNNYQEYVAWDSPAVVWVVSACDELSFESKTWSFPIVGSFTYLGWFDRAQAKEHLEELRKEGLDADLRGAQAYSTLGWFRDPILSTMLGDLNSNADFALGDLANTILHESVHATYYVKGQSSLNESIAQFVADQLTPGYLKSLGGTVLDAYQKRGRDSEHTLQILQSTYRSLEALYANSSLSAGVKRGSKKDILAGARTAFEKSGVKISRELNNAMLVQYRTYHSGWAEMDRIWKACGQNPTGFLAAIERGVKSGNWSEQVSDLDQALRAITGC